MDMSENQAYPTGADRTGELPPPSEPAATAATADTDASTPPAPEPAAVPAPVPGEPGLQMPGTGTPSRVPLPPPAAPVLATTAYPTTAQPYPTAAYQGTPYPQAAQPWPTSSQPAVNGQADGSPQPYPTVPPAQPGLVLPGRRGLVAGMAALVIGLAGGVAGGLVGYALHPDAPRSPLQVTGLTGNGTPAPVLDRSSLADIAAQLQPSIVDIQTGTGEGSGVIISADGHIVTNHHVVQGFRTVMVTFNSGQRISGDVIGTDQRTDLAVVKVDADNLVHAAWGDSDAVQVGDTVLAIGSPLGLQGTVTAGIVSGLHRTITAGSERSRSEATATIGDAIQTDAPINAGNSGGALVNMRAEVIGINTAIATNGAPGNIGVGFAISSNRARAVVDALIAGRPVSHPFLGVQISDAPSGGALVESVVEGSAAAQAGIRAGDVITKVGDRPIRGMEDLIAAIQSSTVGEQLSMSVTRDGTERTITVTVGEN